MDDELTPAVEGGELSYVYAVAASGAALDEAVAEVTGLYGDPVRTVVLGPLAAVVSSVPAFDFSEAGLKARLENLEALEAMARGHHAVVDALAAGTTVLPLRLATVHLDDASTARMLEESQEAFADLLGRLHGHLEWGVKVYADPQAAPAESEEPAAATAGAAGNSPGRAYLQRRRAQRATRQHAHRAAQEAAARVDEAAARLAAEAVAHRPQQGELAAGPGENIANCAYLVHRSRSEEFRAAVADAAQGAPGVRVEVTGPWAPYSFATPAGPSDER